MKLIKSFKCALRGFIYCLVNERSIRIHTVVTLYVLFFSELLSISKEELIIILLTISSVISAELFNTAIEKLSDFCSYEYSPVIRLIKDISAGAVVCCTVFSIIIGMIVFCDIKKILYIIYHFKTNLHELVLLVSSIVLSVLYIIKSPLCIKNLIYKQK